MIISFTLWVDKGGPRNEFYSLLHNEMSNSGLFVGEEDRKCFNHDILALEERNFYIYGQLCSMGVMQGSPSPSFLAPAVADYIVYGKIEKAITCTRDVPNPKGKSLKSWRKLRIRKFFQRLHPLNAPSVLRLALASQLSKLKRKTNFFTQLHCIIPCYLPCVKSINLLMD